MHLELVTTVNFARVCRVKVHPHQEQFVAPVVRSLAEAYVYPEAAWPRAIVDGDRIVGFVMLAIQPHDPIEAYRFYLWRLNIDAGEQGKGYGRFAVQAVIEEGRRLGAKQLHVSWHPGVGGPEEFYLRLGFVKTGEVLDEETVGVLQL
jgi:diamine N-acetyltransferase